MIPFGLFSCLPLNFLLVSPVSSMRASLMFSKPFLKCPWISKRDAGPAASNTCRARLVHEIPHGAYDVIGHGTEARFRISMALTTCLLTYSCERTKIRSLKFCQKERNLLAKDPLLKGIAWKRREMFLPSTFFNKHTFPESVQPTIFPREASRVFVFVGCFP